MDLQRRPPVSLIIDKHAQSDSSCSVTHGRPPIVAGGGFVYYFVFYYYTGWRKRAGPSYIELQIFWKLHGRIA